MISKNHKLIVLMPPKTASNSLRGTLENCGVNFYIDPNPKPQIHLKLSEIVERYDVKNLNDFKIIQLTRNPYERFVSSFFFQKKIIPKNIKTPFSNFSLEEFTIHLKESLDSGNFIKEFYGDESFIINTINSGTSWGGSRLYDTQISWNDLGVKINHFKLEDINYEIERIRTTVNLPIENFLHLNSQNINENYRNLITPKVKEVVLELFENDFEFFGYEK